MCKCGVDFSFWRRGAEGGDAEASLTGATLSQSEKDARSCAWIRYNSVLKVSGAGDEGIAPTLGRGMTRRGAVAPADTQRRGSGANYGAPTGVSWLILFFL